MKVVMSYPIEIQDIMLIDKNLKGIADHVEWKYSECLNISKGDMENFK